MGRKKLQTKNILTRIGEEFNKELEEIKDKRKNQGLDKKRKSTRKLTELIIKHEVWPKIKKDLLKVKLEKKENE